MICNKNYTYFESAEELIKAVDVVDIVTKTISKKRLLHCNPCPLRQGNTCSPSIYGYHVVTGDRKNGCGCNISAKTLSRSSQCPLGKW